MIFKLLEGTKMLKIKTVKNHLSTDEKKDGFCFRSAPSENLDQKALVNEMVAYNSSFTAADILGMFSVLDTVVMKNLAKGNGVQLPFGSLRANATGTCAAVSDSFAAGSGNHQIGFLFSATADAKRQLESSLEYEQVLPDSTQEGKIYRVCTLNDDAKEIPLETVSQNGKIRLHGRNLSFDSSDSDQGVFIENESGKTRITSFDRKGTAILDFRLPPSVLAGEYSLFVVTKPGKSYCTISANEAVKVA